MARKLKKVGHTCFNLYGKVLYIYMYKFCWFSFENFSEKKLEKNVFSLKSILPIRYACIFSPAILVQTCNGLFGCRVDVVQVSDQSRHSAVDNVIHVVSISFVCFSVWCFNDRRPNGFVNRVPWNEKRVQFPRFRAFDGKPVAVDCKSVSITTSVQCASQIVFGLSYPEHRVRQKQCELPEYSRDDE